MTTLLEPPPRLSVVPTAETAASVELTVEEMMVRAIALYESANNGLLDAGRLLASVQALGKKKFPKLIVDYGLEKTQAAKLIKMAEVADFIPSVMAGRLGIHMLIQLGQKRNEAVLDAITDDDTQLSVAQKMKKLRAPAVPKENKPVRFIGNQKGGVGKLRIEVPGRPEAVEIERDWRESGLPPHQWLKSRIDPSSRTDNPALHNIVSTVAPLAMDLKEPSSTETLAAIVTPQPDTTLPSTAAEQPTVYEVATAELHEYLEAQSQSIAPEPQPQQEVSTRFSSSTPPTERYMLGWNPGDQVIANSVVPTFERWCQGKPVLIESVQGKVGSVQQLTVVRCDGESRMSFGNWVEELKSESDAPLSPTLPTAPPQTLYLVGKTKNDWEGEIVQLITAGPVYHRVSRLECEAWTHVKHAYLQEISFEEAVTAQAALSEEILAEVGLRLGDAVQWKIEDVTFTGTISRLTKLGAFIDEGQPGLAWIKYHRIQKVQSVASLDPETNNNQQFDCSQATNGVAVASVEVDYELLSDALKKAASWQEVEKLVERDSSRLTFAVKAWTPVQKNSLRNLLTSYLESDADALIWHQVDWLPLTSLKKSFKQLFFKVRNIMEGLTAPWLNGFAFVHVDDFGLDTEEWIFIDPASSQNIKVNDRKDFAVQAS